MARDGLGAAIPIITAISASEVELEFETGKPVLDEIIWVKVEA